jgi:multiple sugar transport system substrate-binding protein
MFGFNSEIRPRRVSLVAASAVLALMVGGCGGNPSNEGEVELNFTWWGADARAALTEEVVAAFEEENPGITINSNWGSWDGYWDRLATATAGGDAPDVMQMDESRIAAYGERQALLDLSTVEGSLDLSAMEPEVLLTGEVGEALVGVPVGVGLLSIGVNPAILERAGVEMPDDATWTWDDLAEMSAQVSVALGDEGITGLDYFGTGTADIGVFARQRGQEVFARDGEEPITKDTLEDYFEFALDLMETGAVPQASLQTEYSTAALEQQPFATKTTAFHLLFHSQIQAFVDASGLDLKLLRLPAATDGESAHMTNKASMYWSISSRSEHPEEAAKFIDFLIQDEKAAEILLVDRGVPAIPAVQDIMRPHLSDTGVMSLEFASDLQDEVVEPPQVTPANASDFTSEFLRIGSEVIFDRQSPAQGADSVLAILENHR